MARGLPPQPGASRSGHGQTTSFVEASGIARGRPCDARAVAGVSCRFAPQVCGFVVRSAATLERAPSRSVTDEVRGQDMGMQAEASPFKLATLPRDEAVARASDIRLYRLGGWALLLGAAIV